MDMSKPNQLSGNPQGQLAPYRFYVCLLHASVPGVRRIDEHRVALKTGPLSTHFRCRHSRIHDWIAYLVNLGLIEVEAKEYGRRYIYIIPPDLNKGKRNV